MNQIKSVVELYFGKWNLMNYLQKSWKEFIVLEPQMNSCSKSGLLKMDTGLNQNKTLVNILNLNSIKKMKLLKKDKVNSLSN